MNKFLASLTVSLPPVIALVLIDPNDVLGIYDPWIAGALGFVLATAAYITGKESVKSEADTQIKVAQADRDEAKRLYSQAAARISSAESSKADYEKSLNTQAQIISEQKSEIASLTAELNAARETKTTEKARTTTPASQSSRSRRKPNS